jgi:hypothetical protein
LERFWEVMIAGEGSAIGTVRAPNESAARSLGIELAETHCRLVGAEFDPEWVQITPHPR